MALSLSNREEYNISLSLERERYYALCNNWKNSFLRVSCEIFARYLRFYERSGTNLRRNRKWRLLPHHNVKKPLLATITTPYVPSPWCPPATPQTPATIRIAPSWDATAKGSSHYRVAFAILKGRSHGSPTLDTQRNHLKSFMGQPGGDYFTKYWLESTSNVPRIRKKCVKTILDPSTTPNTQKRVKTVFGKISLTKSWYFDHNWWWFGVRKQPGRCCSAFATLWWRLIAYTWYTQKLWWCGEIGSLETAVHNFILDTILIQKKII